MPAGQEMVVTVHGLWNTGLESGLLRRRLEEQFGFRTRGFSYRSIHDSFTRSVERLQEALADIDAATVHLVGHSLGGLVVLGLYERFPEQKPGRVVLLGSPVRGCAAARRLAEWPWGRAFLGNATSEELLFDRGRRWDLSRELGIIAGTAGLGMGRVLAQLERPHDGTVTVGETHLPGATAHLELPVTHTGMLFSEAIVRHTGAFLCDGRFAPAPG